MTVAVDGNDSPVVLPVLRTSFRLEGRSGEPSGAPAEFSAGTFLDVEATRADGSFDQALGAGEAVVLGSVDLTGPDTLAFDVTRSALSFRWRIARAHESGLGVEGTGGLELGRLQVDARSRTPPLFRSASLSLDTFGLVYGGAVTYTPLPWLQLRGGVEAVAAVARGLSGISVVNLDLGAVVAVQDSVRVGAGWRRTEIGFDPGGDSLGSSGGESDIDAELSGLSVWLWLVF
ncbi:MAG: hypothetical protein ACJA0P_000386 [Planctomycetota bacterium]|jgi:hypothetical protein